MTQGTHRKICLGQNSANGRSSGGPHVSASTLALCPVHPPPQVQLPRCLGRQNQAPCLAFVV